MPIDLSADSLVVKQAVEQAGIKPGKNGGATKPVGSSKKIHLPKTEEPLPPEPKGKTYKVELTVQQEARLCREAFANSVTNSEHLQNIVDEKLTSDIGAPFISSASFMGDKVKGPSNKKLQVITNEPT